MIKIEQSINPVLVPEKECPWAELGVLNPAVVKDPVKGQLHMLFRATGAYPHKSKNNECPYPIFLGYAVSANGKTWDADFSNPALTPALEDDIDKMYITNIAGEKVINYTNGAIEDPRIFSVENELYLSAACRMFPPGPYWEYEGISNKWFPQWAFSRDNPFGRAASENVTVTVLYKLNLEKLKKRIYNEAFEYIGNITDPELGENRDVFFFPERFTINNRQQYVALIRPEDNHLYPGGNKNMLPSIWLACADSFQDFGNTGTDYKLLAEPVFEWETERIGASWPVIKTGPDEWLLSYHGKKDMKTGYTQSFMILKKIF